MSLCRAAMVEEKQTAPGLTECKMGDRAGSVVCVGGSGTVMLPSESSGAGPGVRCGAAAAGGRHDVRVAHVRGKIGEGPGLERGRGGAWAGLGSNKRVGAKKNSKFIRFIQNNFKWK
jgi:hypothetical protein